MDSKMLEKIARDTRREILSIGYNLGAEGIHLGGCMSLVEILTYLYQVELMYENGNPFNEFRDRVIMSKGHGSVALYAAMHQAGLINEISLKAPLLGDNRDYYKQVVRNPKIGLEFSSGSLGQGLAFGIGIAWSLKKKCIDDARVFVVLGDGECDEGSVWEAASIAGHHKLNNIIVIVDRNRLQIDGNTEDINKMQNLKERWTAFGFKSYEINGHSFQEISNVFDSSCHDMPVAIIANTVKGKGISFAENNAEWHQRPLTKELYEKALLEVR